jgi:BlaI family transcriptional regulator, penicillinase repressor
MRGVGRRRRNVTEAELDVLKELWGTGATTIRDLTGRLYPAGGPAHYATVQKLLERLEAKGFVRRRPGGRVNVYTATVDRDTLIERRLRETAEALCDGSLTPLLTHLVGAVELNRDELRSLKDLVEGRRPGRRRR